MDRVCGTCRFYRHDWGVCVRYAPRPAVWPLRESPREDTELPYAFWPDVLFEDWCGEYQAASGEGGKSDG